MHLIAPLFFLALPALTSTRVVNDPTFSSSASEMTQLKRSPIASDTLQDTTETRPLAADIVTEVAPEEPQILKDRSVLESLAQSESIGREHESAVDDTALMTRAEPMQCGDLKMQYRLYMLLETRYQQVASTQSGGAYVFRYSVEVFEKSFRCQEPSSKCRGLVDDLMVLLQKNIRQISEIVDKQPPNRNRLGHINQIVDVLALGASDVQTSIERLEALLGCPERPDTIYGVQIK